MLVEHALEGGFGDETSIMPARALAHAVAWHLQRQTLALEYLCAAQGAKLPET